MESSLVPDLLRLAAVGLLVLANAFFVAAEFSLVSVRRTRIADWWNRATCQRKQFRQLCKIQIELIAATQLGITLASFRWVGWASQPWLT